MNLFAHKLLQRLFVDCKTPLSLQYSLFGKIHRALPVLPIRLLLYSIGLLFIQSSLTSCSSSISQSKMSAIPSPTLYETNYTSFDGDSFDYLSWNIETEPKCIIIATHGINGAASDYENLANYLHQHQPNIAIYAHNTRGQGLDPNKQRRGHIHDARDWHRDLYTFSALVKEKHPESTIIWMGESMGSLITAHTVAELESRGLPSCDAMILSSPIVSLGQELPGWKRFAVKLAASVVPTLRIPLEGLSEEEDVKVTKRTSHSSQATTNNYHVTAHSLRLITSLAKHIEEMQVRATKITVPTLIVHGGKDFFSKPHDIEALIHSFPEKTPTKQLYYPEAYHLLMYDDLRETIFSDITAWIQDYP